MNTSEIIRQDLDLAEGVEDVEVESYTDSTHRIVITYNGYYYRLAAAVRENDIVISNLKPGRKGAKIAKEHENDAINVAYAVLVYLNRH